MAGQALIEPGRFLDALGIEVELLLDAAHRNAPTARVVTAPGFTVGEVVRHLGGTYRTARLWILQGGSPRRYQQYPEPGQSTEDYLRTGLAELLTLLRANGADSAAATWWPADRTIGFWCRRMAHETTIHRIDLQETAALAGERPVAPEPRSGESPAPIDGPITPVSDDYAVDGVDEVLTLWFVQRLAMLGVSGTAPWSVGIRTGGHHWIARAGPGFTEAWRCSPQEARRADVLVSGTPMRVYLWLWGRRDHRAVTWNGNADAAARLWALMRLATK
ncbi:hypothetical protein HFP15_08475 [Amycolatopsis sp. K13G38]|uniref:Mycothiol-dependent maleylpyruvate isomerase metal-binding domain-containing protein n=1 Tax=Amycolatopsis acididurans TaxID=2724524 RepID=A0ABX1J1R3_9PSEU|nr:maleylpyruvate isomerase N-terminal domain-containing protein [Amycolatopsis acididurans]NKQ52914.1 hypothetical protein [Amycolatopsis acididurans]